MLKDSNILFKEKDEKLFWHYWQKFLDSRKSSSRYLKITLEHNIEFSKLKSLFVSDKSFVYVVGKEPMACVFLPIEKRDGNLWISHDINSGYVDAPLFKDHSVEEKIFGIIDEIARKNKVAKALFAINPIEGDNFTCNYLQKYDYLDTSILRYIIDLNLGDDLLSLCRRNHQRNIKKMSADKDFSVFFMTKDNPSYALHEEYRLLHHRCSRRITRPKETFDHQYKKLLAGNAVLAGLKYKKANIGFVYFEYNADKAISHSAADDPDYESKKLPIYHIIFFKAMEYLKKTGVRYLDPEQPACPSTQMGYYPDEKKLNIAHFKRGFGGYFTQGFRGIKYFSKEVFDDDMKIFKNNYLKNLEGN